MGPHFRGGEKLRGSVNFIHLRFYEKCRQRRNNEKKNIVATNVVASQLPARQPLMPKLALHAKGVVSCFDILAVLPDHA